MQQLILSKAQPADPKQTPAAPAEQLVWMGTAYGRRAADKMKQGPAPLKTAGAKTAFSISVAKTSHRLAVRTAYAGRALGKAIAAYPHRNYQTAGLALMAVCAAVSAAALVQSFAPDHDAPQKFVAPIPASDTTAAPRSDLAVNTMVTFPADQPAALQSPQSEPLTTPASEPVALTADTATPDAAAKDALEQANAAADAAAAQSNLAIESERTARVKAEEKAAQLSSEVALHKAGRDSALSSAAELSALLDAERKARAEAELAARTAQDELMRKVAANAALAEPQETRVAVAAPEPARDPITSASRTAPSEMMRGAPQAPQPSVNISSNSMLMTQAFKEGQNLWAKGELAAARKQFEKAAIAGLPEGALALGETFDPVALNKAGFKQPGDAGRAREWYRRAHELARTSPRPHRQARRIEPETQSNLQIPRLE